MLEKGCYCILRSNTALFQKEDPGVLLILYYLLLSLHRDINKFDSGGSDLYISGT